MKTINELEVAVSYRVSLCQVEVPNNVYEALCDAHNTGGSISLADGYRDEQKGKAVDYLSDIIDEQDACHWEYEINILDDGNISEDEND
jgi:hypothetical protein